MQSGLLALGTAFALAVGVVAYAGTEHDLIATDKKFSAMSATHGSNAAFLAYMADDGRLFGTGNQPPIAGKSAAAARFSDPKNGNGDPRTNVLTWTPEHAELSHDNTLGYTDGRWLFRGKNGKGGAIRFTGHYLTVWRQDAHGRWKAIADMGTTDPKPENK